MKINNFQLIVVIIFVVGAVVGVFVFSGAIPIGNKNTPGGKGTVTLWGTYSSNTLSPIISNFNTANPTFVLNYVEKSAADFDQELLEALAEGAGPDLFFLPDNLAVSYEKKLFTIPYESFPVSTFKNTFAGASEVFMTGKGVLAFPISIDPLVMYYNRNTLDSNGVIYPPKTWDELVLLIPTLNKKDEDGKITKSTVALGQFSNVDHAKDIMAALFMQTGNPIISLNNENIFSSVLDSSFNNYRLSSVLKFYTDFADSLNGAYSWNKSLPQSSDLFSRENLAFYFGFGSELQSLINKNPNQNFLAAPLPQIKNTNAKLTSARVNGVAISKSSKNFDTAYIAASLMASGEFANAFAQAFKVAPARRDLLSQKPKDVFSPVFYDSALYARSWLDPSPEDTSNIFRVMVESVLSGAMSPEEAIKDANAKFNLLLIK